MKVLVVDDHPMVMEYLRSAVAKALPEALVRSATDLEAGLELAREDAPDMALLDLGLPGCGGIESLLTFRREFPEIRVVVVSANDDLVSVRGALAAGAAGFIPKTAGPKVIVNALRLVAEGGRYIPDEALSEDSPTPAAGPADSTLTERQAEVLARLLAGRNIREIAKDLGISESTAKHHVQAIYSAFGVRSRADLILAAARRKTGTG